MAEKTVTFTPPKTLALCADQLYSTREHRLALQKEVDALQSQETSLREHIINTLPKSEATGVAGKLVRVSIAEKIIYQAKDWDGIRAYIIKNQKKNPGVWALLNKAVNAKTAGEMWDAGVRVDGLEQLKVRTLSMNKV